MDFPSTLKTSRKPNESHIASTEEPDWACLHASYATTWAFYGGTSHRFIWSREIQCILYLSDTSKADILVCRSLARLAGLFTEIGVNTIVTFCQNLTKIWKSEKNRVMRPLSPLDIGNIHFVFDEGRNCIPRTNSEGFELYSFFYSRRRGISPWNSSSFPRGMGPWLCVCQLSRNQIVGFPRYRTHSIACKNMRSPKNQNGRHNGHIE